MPMTWESANQQYLVLALAGVQHALAQHSGQVDLAEAHPPPDEGALADLKASMSQPPALDQICDLFDLSPFERAILLLCAGIELDARLGPLCAAAQGDPQRDYPTFSLALAALPEAHWSALSPDAPLRYWQLLRLQPDRGLAKGRLRIDERILHYLVGVSYLTEDLAPLLQPVNPPQSLVPSQAEIARDVATTLAHAETLPLIQLAGPDSFSRGQIAAAACGQLDLALYRLPAALLPAHSSEIEALRRLWLRESALSRTALLLDCEESDLRRHAGLRLFLDNCQGVLILSGRERQPLGQVAVITYEVPKPTAAEQRRLWLDGLGALAPTLDGQIEQLVTQFNLTPPDITAACVAVAGYQIEHHPRDEAAALSQVLWQRCRVGVRPRLEALAQRIETQVTWEDLILPRRQQAALQEIAMQVRRRGLVYEDWGFRRQHDRGLGIAALFGGGSGTGKTLAAEVLANELQLDLYRIDLSSVVDKYIGETEKNLRRIFDTADAGGVILLFDEADALFGKRGEVKDSHDRYANIEVSYLLQRMEQYRGLAILTSNLKDALDEAFLRRLRFVVEFPFPDAAERAAIWARVFPADTPVQELNQDKLARLNVAGGSIRNIALNAAFQAAEAGAPVGMAHILWAARREYEKLQRPLTDAETRDWIEENV